MIKQLSVIHGKSAILSFTMIKTSAVIFALFIASSSAFFWQQPRKTCTEIGLSCSDDCKFVEYCPAATGTSAQIRECAEGSFCEKDSKGVPECTAKSCSTALPKCSIKGAMPSAADCHVYFLCLAVGDVAPVRQDCPNNEVFNTVSNKCDSTTKCRAPVVCAKAGDNGIVDPEAGLFCFYCSDINTPYVYPCSK